MKREVVKTAHSALSLGYPTHFTVGITVVNCTEKQAAPNEDGTLTVLLAVSVNVTVSSDIRLYKECMLGLSTVLTRHYQCGSCKVLHTLLHLYW